MTMLVDEVDGYTVSRAFDQFDDSYRYIDPLTAMLVAGSERSDVADKYRDRCLAGELTYWRSDERDDVLSRIRTPAQTARALSAGVTHDVIDPGCGDFFRLKYKGSDHARDYLRLLFVCGRVN
jgi:hypothetical protein